MLSACSSQRVFMRIHRHSVSLIRVRISRAVHTGRANAEFVYVRTAIRGHRVPLDHANGRNVPIAQAHAITNCTSQPTLQLRPLANANARAGIPGRSAAPNRVARTRA